MQVNRRKDFPARAAVSSRDISDRTGYSLSTVTKVLRKDGERYGIKPETRDRIIQVAQAMGYAPNLAARSLRTGKSGVVVIIGHLHGFAIWRAGEEAAVHQMQARGYRGVRLSFGLDGKDDDAVFSEIASLKPEGVLVAEVLLPERALRLEELNRRGIPVVGLNYLEGLRSDQAYVDRAKAAYLAATHLIELGHRRIGYLMPRDGGWYITERRRGYQQAFVDAGLPFEDSRIITLPPEGSRFRAGYRVLTDNLFDIEKYSAIMALNDQIAIGLLRACYERGIAVPRDVSLVGAENLPESEYTFVPLTTVAFPVAQTASMAVDMLLERMRGATMPPRSIPVEPQLIIRQSTGEVSN